MSNPRTGRFPDSARRRAMQVGRRLPVVMRGLEDAVVSVWSEWPSDLDATSPTHGFPFYVVIKDHDDELVQINIRMRSAQAFPVRLSVLDLGELLFGELSDLVDIQWPGGIDELKNAYVKLIHVLANPGSHHGMQDVLDGEKVSLSELLAMSEAASSRLVNKVRPRVDMGRSTDKLIQGYFSRWL